ncbi:NAD+ synthase (glutamine-hydrolysing) [Mitsuaria sp. PDC51]|jgi:NAD+ synthase (glutamine-hydrolysing)|nr:MULTISPECIES: NAD(+) synthase [unclassified Roseateles]MBB3292303.1 NAD+ synthase (glutamine-hydrolyzing) [Mitsuaria sp. BK041]MBB3361521.1 NAD+ synthase (glutamine-hydrolyzing) [Mitsuaria sp. BK045]SFR74362.1 NAD+ synthase (glutamine-hydrolysing) [Mitsuaria sp. PDC51]
MQATTPSTPSAAAHAGPSFDNLYTHDFARVAVGVPLCRVADPAFNGEQTAQLLREAAADGAAIAAFPELGLAAYTSDDLFHQRPLLDGCEAALAHLLAVSKDLPTVAIVGLPLRVEHRLFNCAVVFQRGRLLAVLPKTYLPNYGEFYEARQFNAADEAISEEITLLGQRVAFGTRIVIAASDLPLLRLHVEICEDVWTPIPPSSYAALAGATVLVNLSASNITVGKSGYRHQLVGQQSARCLAAYVYSSAGAGESSTDLAWDGQALVYENGSFLAESERFQRRSQLVAADVDLERLSRERMRQTSFGDSVRHHAPLLKGFRTVEFELGLDRAQPLPLRRRVERFPYVPADRQRRDERCNEVFHIQVQALVQRLVSSGIHKLVVGISGGLDSTHALLVAARAMDQMGWPRSNILGVTMPGFATGSRTRDQALRLMREIGCEAREIDIRPSCEQMLKDLGHPYAKGEPVYDVTFENVQAGERTSHLFRLANHTGALVLGTGDLSELALGWCTYGVGDHMSHYNVNASVPKTLIQYLVRWVAETEQLGHAGRDVLLDILGTEISPELVPQDAAAEGSGLQSTEDRIGRYELQDFNLFYTIRHGYSPTKIAFLARHAWGDRTRGDWPDGEHVRRNEYPLAEIKRVLRIFVSRFFRGSQFKRSCVPNAPKVGSGGSLSPRGDWRAPSDSEPAVWLADLDRIPD